MDVIGFKRSHQYVEMLRCGQTVIRLVVSDLDKEAKVLHATALILYSYTNTPSMEEYYNAFGQIEADWNLKKLLPLFKSSNAQIRESSHYEDERYLLIETSQGAQVSFERITKDEILIRGDATTKEQLIVICKGVSTVLASHQLKHRIELYDEKNLLYDYHYYAWALS